MVHVLLLKGASQAETRCPAAFGFPACERPGWFPTDGCSIMDIRLTTFGVLRVRQGGAELDWLPAQRVRAALLTYMAVERRVSRASLATLFWPESDERRARQALRQGVYHLRKALGGNWAVSSGQELRVREEVRTDAGAFTAALQRRDVEAAARLYRGPFLDGVHLLDLKGWEAWVDSRRAEFSRLFRSACRDWIADRRAAGDLPGCLDAARHWVGADPLDDEAEHRLIETLAAAGERAEAIRRYEVYASLLASDGLRPLDQTEELIGRVRAMTTPWPEPPLVSPSQPPVAPPAAPCGPPGRRDRGGPPAPPSGTRSGPVFRRPRVSALALALVLVLGGAVWLAEPRRAAAARFLNGAGTHDVAGGIVLADIVGPDTDPALGTVVTDALRIDLMGTERLRPVDPSDVAAVLDAMPGATGRTLSGELAREVARRRGVDAVLEGEVAVVGAGYVLTATLRSVPTGRMVAAFRETADRPEDLIAAIDRLSQAIRHGEGESSAAPGG
jgi:DNA-binding SARP family transcriptional activator